MKIKHLVATLVVVVAVVLAVVAYSRAKSTAHIPQTSEPVDLRFQATDKSTSGASRYSSNGVANQLEASVMEAMSGVVVDGSQSQASEVAFLRIDLMFDPDFDRWLERVATQTSLQHSSYDNPEFRSRWERSLQPYQNPLVNPDSVWIEQVDPDRSFPDQKPGTMIVRSDNSLEAPYRPIHRQANAPNTTGQSGLENREAVEVFIPILAKDANGKPLGATISFVLGRNTNQAPWREIEMFIYLGPDGFNRKIMIPGF